MTLMARCSRSGQRSCRHPSGRRGAVTVGDDPFTGRSAGTDVSLVEQDDAAVKPWSERGRRPGRARRRRTCRRWRRRRRAAHRSASWSGSPNRWRAPTVAGEHEGAVGRCRGRRAARAGPRRRSRRRAPGTARSSRPSTSSPTATARARGRRPSTLRTRKSPRSNVLVLVDDEAEVQARRQQVAVVGVAALDQSAQRGRGPARWPAPRARCRSASVDDHRLADGRQPWRHDVVMATPRRQHDADGAVVVHGAVEHEAVAARAPGRRRERRR